MTTKTPDHDLDHEVYLDPKDHKEHINHGMIEYTEADLEMHNDAFHAHSEDEVNKEEGGLYLITDLCHFITAKETYTKLVLTRDSFGRVGSPSPKE